MKKIIFIASYKWSLLHFRGKLIKKFVEAGYQVTVMAPSDDNKYIDEIKLLGANFKKYSIDRNGLNLFKDVWTLVEIYQALKIIKPNIILAYTIKPIIYTGLIMYFIKGIKFNALITGLGYTFHGQSFVRKLFKKFITLLYKLSLFRAKNIIFQNSESRDIFVSLNITKINKTHVVNGSGIDINDFSVKPFTKFPLTFLLIARLLKDKGIIEYFKAASIVKKKYPDVNFLLIGQKDTSPNCINTKELKELLSENNVNYLGYQENVKEYIIKSHVYVLPSHHEGIPRTILEAMSIGRPIITTDVIGCRETVVNRKNGLLIPKDDYKKLSDSMIWFIKNSEQCTIMGNESRKIVEKKFNVEKINFDMITILNVEQNNNEKNI